MVKVVASGGRVDGAECFGRVVSGAGGFAQWSTDEAGGQGAQVAGGDAMRGWVERRVAGRRRAERVELRG